jgi:RsiW-degrading membrane proteinase PrsW (M82 family)
MQPARRTHWPSVFQLLYSGAGLIFWWGSAAAAITIAASEILISGKVVQPGNSVLLSAAGLALAGLLFLPPLVYAFLRLTGKPSPELRIPTVHRLVSPGILALWLGSAALVWLISPSTSISGLILAPFYLLAVSLPVLWLVIQALKGLRTGSAQRGWSMLSTGMLLSPAVIITIQIILGILALIGLAIYFSNNPDAVSALNILAGRLAGAADNPEAMQRILRSYLEKPWVLAALLAFLSGFTPLLEELFKTVGVWLAARRLRTPAEGFGAGVLCGAGFALVESLFSATSAPGGSALASLTLARGGTDLLHILNGGLMGWALASAWQERRYGRLFLAYLGAVLLHGAWNAASVLGGIIPLLNMPVNGLGGSNSAVNPGLVALPVLAVLMFMLLLYFNRRLRVESNVQTAGVMLPASQPPDGGLISEIIKTNEDLS